MRKKITFRFFKVDGVSYYTTFGLMSALNMRKTSFWKEVRSGRIQVAMKHPSGGNLYGLDAPEKWKSQAQKNAN